MERNNLIASFGIVLFMIGILGIIALLKGGITGYVIYDEGNYTDYLNLDVDSNTTYTWVPNHEGSLGSLKISGYFEGDSFSFSALDKLVYSYGYNSLAEESVTVSNGSGEINLDFGYGDEDGYDDNNDGITYFEDVIDFNVKGTFNFDVDYSKLCTKYAVKNLDDILEGYACYGDVDCCAFLNLESSSSNWDDNFYLNEGKYNAGKNNTVTAQIVYYDVNLSDENLHSNIYNSEEKQLRAIFNERVYFNDVCVESCSLNNYNNEFYDFDIRTDGLLHVENVSYELNKQEGRMRVLDTPGACGGDISLNLTTSNPVCGSNINVNLYDNTIYCSDGSCWDSYINATIHVPENVSSIDLNYTLINTTDVSPAWRLRCNNIGNYTINITLNKIDGSSCQESLNISVESWVTNPVLVLNFSTIPNLSIGQSYSFNLTVNNTGDDNATNALGSFNSSNANGVNLSRAINISLIQNRTSNITNYTFTALVGGDYNFSTSSITYARSNGAERPQVGSFYSNNFHINYNPNLSQVPNITLVWNSSDYSIRPYNNSINLLNHFSDGDSYDTCDTIYWNYTNVTNTNITLNITNCVLNVSASNNWTGRVNISLIVIDTYNQTATSNFSVFVSNDTAELCNNADDDGDSLIDEGTISQSCCDYSSCSTSGTQSCLGNGTWGNCDGDIASSSGSSGGSSGSRSGPANAAAPDTGTTTTPTIPAKKEQFAPQDSGGSSDTTIKNVIEGIFSNRFRMTREIVVTEDRTQITEKIRDLDLDGLEDVKLKITIPKNIENSALNIKKIDEFDIIREDPEIIFDLGNFSALQVKSVQYVLNNRLSRDEIKDIIANITLKEVSDEERKKQLEKDINETAKYLNLTQDVTLNWDKNQTEFKIKLDYMQNETVLGDVYIYTEIPKCLVKIIKEELIESDQEFEIVAEDPLIVWHFKNLLDVKEINYNIKAIADEDCANQAKALAVAKQIVQVKFSPKQENMWMAVAIIPIILLFLVLFALFPKSIQHENPKIHSLIHYVKHHFKHGFKEDHIRKKLIDEGYNEKEIEEALKLNSRNKLHYWMQRLEFGYEEAVLFLLIVLSVMDALKFLKGDLDYINKIASLTLLGFLVYHISITKVMMGVRKRFIDLILIVSYFLLTLKDWVSYANTAFVEALNNHAIVTDLYSYIIKNNNIFDKDLFIVGIILISLTALYLAIKEEVKAPSFLSIVHFHPKKSKNPLKIFFRFCINEIMLFAVFIVIFNLMAEWIGIILGSVFVFITLMIIFILVIKHRKKFVPSKLMLDISETSDTYYQKLIELFHYKKMIFLGISGMLILHIFTDLINYMIPYIIGSADAFYFDRFDELHTPIFNLMSSGIKSLFGMQAAGLPLLSQMMILLGFLLNIIGLTYLIALPAYVWYHMFKNRKLPLDEIPKLKLNEFHIFMSVTSILFSLLNPVFIISSLKKIGMVGVDIQTKVLDLADINIKLIIALSIGIMALVLSIKLNSTIKKIVLTSSMLFFAYYIFLFFQNTIVYYVGAIKTLLLENIGITLVLILFLLINIGFYSIGMVALFIELYIRKEIWFEGHNIKLIDKHYKKHHNFHFIHHHNAHKEHVHGEKEEFLENYIKHHMMDGEQLISIQQHLEQQGWPTDVIKSASKNVLDDRNLIEFINKMRRIEK